MQRKIQNTDSTVNIHKRQTIEFLFRILLYEKNYILHASLSIQK